MASDDFAVLQELEFALAEAASLPVDEPARRRLMDHALAARRPGATSTTVSRVSGATAFDSAVKQMDSLLGGLGESEWGSRTIRGLDVQGLVGHLIGVERAFADVLEGIDDGATSGDHVDSTQSSADAQRGVPSHVTLGQWRESTSRTLRAIAASSDDPTERSYYGVTLPMDQLLVVRAFEVWVHHEDVRRATNRQPASPADTVLARMTELAMDLLPAGLRLAGRTLPGTESPPVRVVLTGAGGGTWLVALDGSAATRPNGVGDPDPSARILMSAADFCRVVGNRTDPRSAAAIMQGDPSAMDDLFAAAAALALD